MLMTSFTKTHCQCASKNSVTKVFGTKSLLKVIQKLIENIVSTKLYKIVALSVQAWAQPLHWRSCSLYLQCYLWIYFTVAPESF